MADGTWRPLSVETEEDIAEYNALHDDVPSWMAAEYWELVQRWVTSMTERARMRYTIINTKVVLPMSQTLRITLKTLETPIRNLGDGERRVQPMMSELKQHPHPLEIADYLIGHTDISEAQKDCLEALLTRSNSAWTVGTRSGSPGLVHRVPVGVQKAADSVMGRAQRAGVRLAKAWEALYGLNPDASVAYGAAIKAIEDAAVPVVSPTNTRASLGTVIRDMESQKNWTLPMLKPADGESGKTIIEMMKIVWVGQHDRHGGQPSAPGDVSLQEATVAVSMAVTLVNLFHSGVIQRPQK